jgi:hypothetical protein
MVSLDFVKPACPLSSAVPDYRPSSVHLPEFTYNGANYSLLRFNAFGEPELA